ncbi:unnamed protein product, partial [Mesorhabditis belari]|uniref:2,4-dienoyl-CoA reductase n=1 Tax=Mesorhabditis belari TaxID=2138241 RepID=A0AAF3F4N5_9BILA
MACSQSSKFFPILNNVALPKDSLKDKLALVTGGGTGLGRAIAKTFASLGARVIIASRRQDVLQTAATEIEREIGAKAGSILVCQLDVKNPDAIKTTIDTIEEKTGRLPNIIVNNAAGNFVSATERLSPNAVKAVVETVMLGTMYVTLEIAKRAIKRGEGGTVLSITTPYARHGGPFTVPSAIAKAGVENMTRSLSTEWAKYGWRFNVIAPGPIPTEGAFGRLNPGSMEDGVKAAAATVPVGRTGTPEELANLTSYICSDYSSWLNGAFIDFDGGQQWFNHGSSIAARALHDLSEKDWDEVEELIRGRTGKTKSKSKL